MSNQTAAGMVCYAYRCYRPTPDGFGWVLLGGAVLGVALGLLAGWLLVRSKHG